jgi:hypothetical protein
VGLHSQAAQPLHGLRAACLHSCQVLVLAQLALSHAEALPESPDRVLRQLHLQFKSRHSEAHRHIATAILSPARSQNR